MLILTTAELQIRLNCFTLFSGYDFLDVVEFIERFEGREVIDVETKYLIPHLTEHWVIELEEGELHAFARSGDLCRGLANGTYL